MDVSEPGEYSPRLAEYYFRLGTVDKLEEGFALLESHIRSLGFDAVAYSAMPRSIGAPGRFNPVFLTSRDYSKDFLIHYEEAGLWQQDFTIERIQNGLTDVMDWQFEAHKNTLTAVQKDVIDLAAYEYGIKNAVTIPTQSDQHVIAGASVIAYVYRPSFEIIMKNHFAEVHQVLKAFHQFVFARTYTASYFYQPLIDTLTTSQKRVLAFIVTGRPQKHSKEFIGLSPTRTGNILSELYDCLGVRNVSHLSYLAGQHRLIEMLDT